MTKKIAIAIDTSGSMFSTTVDVFSVGLNCNKINIQKENGGSLLEPIIKLSKEYDIVYFFTDDIVDLWRKMIPNNVIIVNAKE